MIWTQREVGWATHLFIQLHRVAVFGEEWRIPGKHFKNEHAEGVPIDTFVVPFGLDDLWRH